MIAAILDAEIPVMGHLVLTPQSVHGAWADCVVQGKERGGRRARERDAQALVVAGCFAIVLEGVPDVVAAPR